MCERVAVRGRVLQGVELWIRARDVQITSSESGETNEAEVKLVRGFFYKAHSKYREEEEEEEEVQGFSMRGRLYTGKTHRSRRMSTRI